MLRRREKAGKALHTAEEHVRAEHTGKGKDQLDLLVGNARVETDQISMSASRARVNRDRTADHARGMREELLRQADQAERAQKKLEDLEKEIHRMQEACRQEVLCRQQLQEQVLRLMEQSKHYTGLMKVLQKPLPPEQKEGDEGGSRAWEERQETVKRLVQLLKENNIMLGNMARELSLQQNCWEEANPFFQREDLGELGDWIRENLASARTNLARQEAISGEMDTVEQCLRQQKDSVDKLERVLEEIRGQAQGDQK